MLVVLLRNEGTGGNRLANYEVQVRVNDHVIWSGRIEGHDRGAGWPALLRQLADVAEASEHTAQAEMFREILNGRWSNRGA